MTGGHPGGLPVTSSELQEQVSDAIHTTFNSWPNSWPRGAGPNEISITLSYAASDALARAAIAVCEKHYLGETFAERIEAAVSYHEVDAVLAEAERLRGGLDQVRKVCRHARAAARQARIRSENDEEALHAAQEALSVIAAPRRPDGTYNRSREACEALARDVLSSIDEMLGDRDG